MRVPGKITDSLLGTIVRHQGEYLGDRNFANNWSQDDGA